MTIVSEDEAPPRDADRIEMKDLDLDAVRVALRAFEVPDTFDGLALACLDHGDAPPNVSDRLFRFEHLRRACRAATTCAPSAYRPDDVPAYLTRARALLASRDIDAPAVFLDTGPAAALGALHDEGSPRARRSWCSTWQHARARLRPERPAHPRVYEHHTGEMSRHRSTTSTARL